MYQHGLITPVVALVIWTLIMWIWMYATRIPAMQKAKIDPQEAARTRTLNLPPEVMRVSDNYNHLHEQPTIFYAICFALQFLGQTSEFNIGVAWLYVALRVVHSLVQATANIVLIRFSIFTLATLSLCVLAFQAAVASGLAWYNLP